VDFEPGGLGGELLTTLGMEPSPGEALPGYVAWLPDQQVTLYRDAAHWSAERLRAFDAAPAHRQFWAWLDRQAAVLWQASRAGVNLPLQAVTDLSRAVRCVGRLNLPLVRELAWTVERGGRALPPALPGSQNHGY